MQAPKQEVEITVEAAKPAIELWDVLTEKEREEFRSVAAQLRETIGAAATPQEAQSRALVVLETASPGLRAKFMDGLRWTKQHAWDERTWAQRFILLSLIPTLPVTATKAAGLAIAGTAFRVAVPVVTAAAFSLMGSIVDLVGTKRKPD